MENKLTQKRFKANKCTVCGRTFYTKLGRLRRATQPYPTRPIGATTCSTHCRLVKGGLNPVAHIS